MAARPSDYAHIYDRFTASINERVDCGRFCAPLNGGTPVCCSAANAIPIVSKAEWRHLKARTSIWKPFKPFDAVSRQIVDELHEDACAIECKVAPLCQRENRTLACRSFPFFPYFSKEKDLLGIAYYWIFEDRCWILSNLSVVEPEFVRELIDNYHYLFERDEDERQAFIDQSISARRVFSRWGRPLPVITADGAFHMVKPKSDGSLIPAKVSDFTAHGPFVSQEAYREAVEAYGGDPDDPNLPRLDDTA